jgi:hypothetical protein
MVSGRLMLTGFTETTIGAGPPPPAPGGAPPAPQDEIVKMAMMASSVQQMDVFIAFPNQNHGGGAAVPNKSQAWY